MHTIVEHKRLGAWIPEETLQFSSVQFSSVAQLCPTLCNPMNRSTPGLPVHHQLLESTQAHVHWVGDAIQPSHPLSSTSPPSLKLSQHQGSFQMSQLFTSGGQRIAVSASTSVLPMSTLRILPVNKSYQSTLTNEHSLEDTKEPLFKPWAPCFQDINFYMAKVTYFSCWKSSAYLNRYSSHYHHPTWELKLAVCSKSHS